ncbi:hypothetical protein HMPREF9711_00910 [Myroides odoratimimus CCUG 3837]|uniref:glycosyltransferase family 4 protein n=1 Tax=Myroides odoratimimus TaxID=76832 RepID=UPI000280AC9A|nr:glycosyltransferase family 4 protein [Myroides odoratimimus]EKB05941.1 hypothetical protein HMPREF9711_00910 [Myroides odoratimimus CCUG 3837]
MKILHLSNDYSGSTVYKNLIGSIDQQDIEQVVYNPIREEARVGKNAIKFKLENSELIYRVLLNYSTDRIFFKSKVNKILKDVEKVVDLTKINCIHAHTWYSDGSVAYELFLKYKIPYIITIRNTDLNLFYSYLYHLRGYGTSILLHAKRIVFIADIYKKRFLKTEVFLKNKDVLEGKVCVLPNGIDDYWLENLQKRKTNCDVTNIKVLYIGKFDKGKNVLKLIKAIKLLNREHKVYRLTLIGGGGNEEKKVREEFKGIDYISFLGPIYDKEELRKEFLSHDIFAMPSKAETFGLVYLEAISQGLPIINTINEGIYGMYENIGESVDYKSITSISNGLEKIRSNYGYYSFNPQDILSNHKWFDIAKKYIELYNKIEENEI